MFWEVSRKCLVLPHLFPDPLPTPNPLSLLLNIFTAGHLCVFISYPLSLTHWWLTKVAPLSDNQTSIYSTSADFTKHVIVDGLCLPISGRYEILNSLSSSWSSLSLSPLPLRFIVCQAMCWEVMHRGSFHLRLYTNPMKEILFFL